jgi:hypothetical protein
MDTWILIFVLRFTEPMPPVVIQGFESEQACQATADRLHEREYRLAPGVVTICIPGRMQAK